MFLVSLCRLSFDGYHYRNVGGGKILEALGGGDMLPVMSEGTAREDVDAVDPVGIAMDDPAVAVLLVEELAVTAPLLVVLSSVTVVE